jgi:hypothetical protein
LDNVTRIWWGRVAMTPAGDGDGDGDRVGVLIVFDGFRLNHITEQLTPSETWGTLDLQFPNLRRLPRSFCNLCTNGSCSVSICESRVDVVCLSCSAESLRATGSLIESAAGER